MRIPASRNATGAVLAPISVVLIAVLGGCGGATEDSESTLGTIRTAPPEPTEPELPEVEPVVVAECPYLDDDDVPALDGGPVGEVRIDDRLEPPACFFSTSEGAVLLTTTVYTVDSAQRAAELVDQSVPVQDAVPVEVDGWTGGITEAGGGALVVLGRGDRVLAIQSLDENPDAVREVAEVVTARLG